MKGAVMYPLLGVSALVAVFLADATSVDGQQSAATGSTDLVQVVQVLKDSSATSLQEAGLVGKVYSGIVTIEDVRVSPQDKTVVFVEVDYGNDSKQYWKMRFEIPNDDRAIQLKKGSKVRFRGTLKEFAIVKSIYLGFTPTRWAILDKAAIE